jgi:hypothetical protein
MTKDKGPSAQPSSRHLPTGLLEVDSQDARPARFSSHTQSSHLVPSHLPRPLALLVHVHILYGPL